MIANDLWKTMIFLGDRTAARHSYGAERIVHKRCSYDYLRKSRQPSGSCFACKLLDCVSRVRSSFVSIQEYANAHGYANVSRKVCARKFYVYLRGKN